MTLNKNPHSGDYIGNVSIECENVHTLKLEDICS